MRRWMVSMQVVCYIVFLMKACIVAAEQAIGIVPNGTVSSTGNHKFSLEERTLKEAEGICIGHD
jgi:hypothetical protein